MAMPQGKQGYRRSVNGYKFAFGKLAKTTAQTEVIASSQSDLDANSAVTPLNRATLTAEDYSFPPTISHPHLQW